MILKRAGRSLVTLLGVSALTFLIMRAAGDPASILLPPDASDHAIAQFRAQNGLDRSLPEQYLIFMRDAVQGDLGTSIRYRQPVSSLLGERLIPTLQLTAAAVLIAAAVGFPLGALGALSRRRLIDHAGRTLALFAQAVPTFYLGILLILLFGVQLAWLPVYGRDGFSSLVLPAITLATYLTPLILRVTRGSYLDVARQSYVQAAHAKGLSSRQVFSRHLTKNAMIPVTTVVGLQLGAALSGAVVTEKVFSWPGVGQLLVDSVATRDYPVVQAVTVYAAAVFIMINFVVDVLYTVLDPRIRLGA